MVRVDLPNRYYDPEKGAALFDRFIKEWQVAEEEGLEIMLNEHHQTPTCVDPAGPLLLAALARVTSKARLLILGNPVANRRQPVRVAEEMAFADILSHGRIEVGFVRGVPYELSPANSNPVYTNERQWEAIDLIIKALTTHDGPFSHEGRFFHARRVNIWPRPYQPPHPPIWVSSTSPDGAARVGARGFVQATFLTGYNATKPVFEAYRRGWREAGRGKDVPIDRLAYAAFVFTADSEARGARRRRGTALAYRDQQDPDALRQSARLQHARSGGQGHAHRARTLSQGADGRCRGRGRHHVRRHARPGAQAIREVLRLTSAASVICWWPASPASSATRRPCTASDAGPRGVPEAARALSRHDDLRPVPRGGAGVVR